MAELLNNRMTRLLDRKLALSFAAVMLLLMVSGTGIAAYLFISLNSREENRLATVSARILGESVNRVALSGKYHARLLVEEMKNKVPELAYISVESPEGRIIAHSESYKNDSLALGDADSKLRLKCLETGLAQYGERSEDGRLVKEVIVPYRQGLDSSIKGVVRTAINLDKVRSEQKSILIALIFLSVVLTLGAVWILYILTQYYSATIRALAGRLQGIADSVPGLLYQFLRKPSGEVNMLFTSQELKKILDLDPDEPDRIFPDFYSCIEDASKQRFNDIVKVAAESPGIWNFEGKYHRRDGKIIEIHIIARTEKVEGGSIFSGVILDVTKQRETGEELRKSRNMLAHIMDCIPQAILWKDKNSVALGCNKKLAELTGFGDPALIPGKTDDELTVRLRSDADYSGEDKEVMLTKKTMHITRSMTGNGGMKRWLDITKVPLEAENGEAYGVLVVIEDISDRKNAEEELRRNRNMLAHVMDSVPQAIVWKDKNSVFLGCNKKFAEMTGIGDPQKIPGLKDADLPWDRHADVYVADDRDVMKTKTARRHIVEPIHTGNGQRWLDTSKIPLTDAAGEVYGVLAVLEDITDLKKAEEETLRLQEQLAQAQKMESVGRLAGGVAHDFNNMLHAILGHADMALAELSPDSPAYSDLVEIQTSAKRSADLTRQLLGFARKQTAIPVLMNLNDTIPGMLKMLKRLIGENITLKWSPGAQLMSVKIDPVQIDQILANLVVNARDAIDGINSGVISIETANTELDSAYPAMPGDILPGSYVMISVSDNGRGMDQSVQEHIFEPFFTTKAMGKGTGLGLATVFGIIRQNKGFINVYSEMDKGTSFKIYLPAVEEKALEPENLIEPEEDLSGSETILLVEDEPQVLKLAVQVLSRNGYRVISADRPVDAIAKMAAMNGTNVDLLVSDMIMPGMSGIELRKAVLQYKPEIKTIFMSGYTSDNVLNSNLRDSEASFLQKPFAMSSFLKKVRAVLDSDKNHVKN